MTNDDENWETQEVIRFLINDAYCWSVLVGQQVDEIKYFVIDEHEAPQGLYDSFDAYPRSNFEDVDWDTVAIALRE